MLFLQLEIELSQQRHEGDVKEKNRLVRMLDNKVSLHSYLKSPCMIATAENLYLDTIIVLSLYYTLQKHFHALVPRERNICVYKTMLFSLISRIVAS